MSLPGPKPKPALTVVREGNPGKNPVREGVSLPPALLDEPAWLDIWPAVRDKTQQNVNRRAREVARREWNRVVPVLRHTAGLAAVDATILTDYCIAVARIDECERDISRRGMLIEGERGWQKNGSTTVAAQYRTQLARYIGELGLSPSARGRITPPKDGDDEDDPFD